MAVSSWYVAPDEVVPPPGEDLLRCVQRAAVDCGAFPPYESQEDFVAQGGDVDEYAKATRPSLTGSGRIKSSDMTWTVAFQLCRQTTQAVHDLRKGWILREEIVFQRRKRHGAM